MPAAELPDATAPVRWSEISARSGRNEKPGLLVGAVGTGLLSDPGELRVALEDTWTTCEWPGLVAEYDLWLTLFDMAVEEGTFLEETELRPLEALPESLQLYRAAAPEYEQGLSWTTSFERAHWFATRLGWAAGKAHRIWEMDAPRESVLASFHATRGEHEYVLDARRLDPDGMREVLPEEWEYLLTTAEDNTAP
ncbi:hypothetical protein ACFSB0_13970 [Aeromicrobium camelliae]